ncbi:MarR family winged helix-turn-helix transcriptional regulator [Nocardioides speluncae]|uniref:MarR family winged helix-turn-helix transcriptional regulator n=1 Tax=Nocardioides speluncae TaxID=2670337 RepID=UPI00137A5182|nr:MarR family transcriptional regulator [Nocardioides speluncae]
MSGEDKQIFDLGPGSSLVPAVRAFRAAVLLGERLHYLMDERLRADGLTTKQAALLTVVIALDRPTVTEAAAALRTSHQNVAQLVAPLERKGFLRVEADPGDRRRKRLAVTEASNAYWLGRDDADEAAVAEWFSALTPTELATFLDFCERILGGLDGSGG